MSVVSPIVNYGGQQETLRSTDVLTGTLTGNPTASRLGYNCWTVDPMLTQAARTLNQNTVYLAALAPTVAVANTAIINVEFQVAVAGASLTYARIGIYSYSGGTATLIGTSADLTTILTTTGIKNASITLSTAITLGDTVYLGVVNVGTTAVALAGLAINYQTGRGSPVRSGTIAGTTLPATVSMSGTALAPSLFFFVF